jgi:plasmid maintenance system antidote protein VapI
MQSGPDQFRDWMRRRGFNQADASRYLEFEPPYVSDLLTERRTPGLTNAILIERRTGIPVEAWTSIEVDDSVEAVALSGDKRKTSQSVKR